MTFAQLKSRVALNLGNMPSSHPHYGEIATAVNDAVRELPKRVIAKGSWNIGLFPELLRRAKAITVADNAKINLPVTAMLIPLKLYSFNQDTDPTDRDRSWPVQYVEPEVYEYLDKSSGNEGWPRIWTRVGNDALIWPVPSTDYVSYVRLHYIMKEADMSADDDTPTLESQWHRAVSDLATAFVLIGMNDQQRANLFFTSSDMKLAQVININAEMQNSAATHQLLSSDLIDVFGGYPI